MTCRHYLLFSLQIVTIHISYGFLRIKYECPGNQEYQQGTTTCVPTCGNKSPLHNCAFLSGGCRCPTNLPYLMDDGVTCTNTCSLNSTRKCPSNQVYLLKGFHVARHSCFDRTPEGDVPGPGCYCQGIGFNDVLRVIGADGQTCIDASQCPPGCPANQVLNMVDGKPCTKTCEFRNPPCDTFVAKRCECPLEAPYLSDDGVTCLTVELCDQQTNKFIEGNLKQTMVHPLATQACRLGTKISDTASFAVYIDNGSWPPTDASAVLAGSGNTLSLEHSVDKLIVEYTHCPRPIFLALSFYVKGAHMINMAIFDDEDARIMDIPSTFFDQFPLTSSTDFVEVYYGPGEIANLKKIALTFSSLTFRAEVRDLHVSWCCDDGLLLSQCPHNQIWKYTPGNPFDSMLENTPICKETCDSPYVYEMSQRCSDIFRKWRCTCPDDKPLLSPDKVTCISKAYCPVKTCFGNQVWTSEGRPCDSTCDVRANGTQCSSFNAFRCQCPEGTYLNATDGITCTNTCPGYCEPGYTRMVLNANDTAYKVQVRPNTFNAQPRDALLGSGASIHLEVRAYYQISIPDTRGINIKELCFTVQNAAKVLIRHKMGSKTMNSSSIGSWGEGFQSRCSDISGLADSVWLRMFDFASAVPVVFKDLTMTACVP